MSNCWFWQHDWGQWTDMIIEHTYPARNIKVEKEGQIRRCLKCNKKQVRMVKA